MYDELIDGLRCCAESTNVIDECAFEDCPYHSHSWGCLDDMLRDAADALEAAEKRIEDLETALASCRAQREQLLKQGEWRWNSLLNEYEWVDATIYCPNCGAKMKGANDADC